MSVHPLIKTKTNFKSAYVIFFTREWLIWQTKSDIFRSERDNILKSTVLAKGQPNDSPALHWYIMLKAQTLCERLSEKGLTNEFKANLPLTMFFIDSIFQGRILVRQLIEEYKAGLHQIAADVKFARRDFTVEVSLRHLYISASYCGGNIPLPNNQLSNRIVPCWCNA